LQPGESKGVSVELDPLALSTFDAGQHIWQRRGGEYAIMIGGSSESLPLKQVVSLK
jgi:beta-glucosidase